MVAQAARRWQVEAALGKVEKNFARLQGECDCCEAKIDEAKAAVAAVEARRWKIAEEGRNCEEERKNLLVQLAGLVDAVIVKPVQLPTVDTLGIKESGVRQTANDCLLAIHYMSVASRDPEGGQNVIPEEARTALEALDKGIKEATKLLKEGHMGKELGADGQSQRPGGARRWGEVRWRVVDAVGNVGDRSKEGTSGQNGSRGAHQSR